MKYKLTYSTIQSWYFPNKALAIWKMKELKASGNYSQGFKIEKV